MEIVICSTPRSGSTIISEAMYMTGKLGRPDEYFNNDKKNLGDRDKTLYEEYYSKFKANSLEDYKKKLASHFSKPNGVHSVKMHFWHFKTVLGSGYFNDGVKRKFIYIYREDLLSQAVSLAIAIHTQKWNSRMDLPSIETPDDISDELLVKCYKSLVFDSLRWEAYFKILDIKPLHLKYETVVDDLQAAMLQLVEFVGISVEHNLVEQSISNLTGKRQAKEINQILKDRLLAETLKGFKPGAPVNIALS